ncbi:MAG: hypothetical protein JWN34_4322 [Bryobacterales bacterium]|jgi:hypothetical protein|nr:hypothetical protein [Bryobacterales bacterium]
MPSAIDTLFRELEISPILVDVGATGEPPANWVELGAQATYVGLGPAASPSGQSMIEKFRTAHAIEKIVTTHQAEQVTLHLMQDCIYSSLLEPNPRAMTDFLEPELVPAGDESLPATTIDAVVADLSLPGIDWLHTNINGLDVPVFKTLSQNLRDGLLAFDTCLDFVDLCVTQESGVAEYPEIIREGFWLSRSFTGGPVKMRRDSLAMLQQLDPAIDERFVVNYHRRTPGWIFVRFLRTAEWLEQREAPRRDYVVLWAFAMVDSHFGFSADLLVAYERRFGADEPLRTMKAETVARLKALKPKATIKSVSRKYLPAPLRRGLKSVLKNIA